MSTAWMADERFWAQVVKDPDGCWLWTGATSHGYGQVKRHGPVRVVSSSAHRIAYEALEGPVPDGLELDHLCEVKACVRPGHLEPVTHAENLRRLHHGSPGVRS